MLKVKKILSLFSSNKKEFVCMVCKFVYFCKI